MSICMIHRYRAHTCGICRWGYYNCGRCERRQEREPPLCQFWDTRLVILTVGVLLQCSGDVCNYVGTETGLVFYHYHFLVETSSVCVGVCVFRVHACVHAWTGLIFPLSCYSTAISHVFSKPGSYTTHVAKVCQFVHLCKYSRTNLQKRV